MVIHAVYLINCASKDKELRKKSLDSLTHALRIGDAIGAAGVVLHPGVPERRAARALDQTSREDDRQPPSRTATPARSCSSRPPAIKACSARDFDQIADLIDGAGGDKRLGLCLDSCHMFVQGYDVTDEAHLSAVLDEADAKIGLDRLGCVHVNDAAAPLGSCRDRHANIGKGEMGKRGLAAFLSEPRFEGLPATLETPGPEKKGPDKKEVTLAKKLRREGLKRRR